jgi:hypothetical protein
MSSPRHSPWEALLVLQGQPCIGIILVLMAEASSSLSAPVEHISIHKELDEKPWGGTSGKSNWV